MFIGGKNSQLKGGKQAKDGKQGVTGKNEP